MIAESLPQLVSRPNCRMTVIAMKGLINNHEIPGFQVGIVSVILLNQLGTTYANLSGNRDI